MEVASETHATSCRALTVVIGITPNEAGDGAVVNIAENTNYRQCLYMCIFCRPREKLPGKIRFSGVNRPILPKSIDRTLSATLKNSCAGHRLQASDKFKHDLIKADVQRFLLGVCKLPEADEMLQRSERLFLRPKPAIRVVVIV